MALVNVGRDLIAACLMNDGPPTFLDNANAHLGVGDSTAAVAAGQTDLQAATNKIRKGMEATYPQRSGNVLSFQAIFDTDEANFNWNEWAVFNAAASGDMFSRFVEDLGTKTNTQIWTLDVDITIGIGT